MKIEDILALTRAGFTKDDIMQLTSAPTDPADPAPADPPADPAPAEQQADAPADDRLSKIETQLDYAIKRLNYLSVKESQQPDHAEETVDDILSSIINPKK